jgi:hypothetical protein
VIRYCLSVFDKIGGAKALAKWGRKNRGEFYALIAQIISIEEIVAVDEIVRRSEKQSKKIKPAK